MREAFSRPAWRFTLLLAAISVIGPLSVDTCLPSLFDIERDLRSAPGSGASVVSVFFLGLAFGQLIYGPVSDRLGRRGPILFGCALFTIGSVLCAMARSMDVLLAARLVQALGGCAGMVIARAIVRDRFGHRDSARVFSLLDLVRGAAPILAPLLGSILLRFMGWRSIFGILAVIGAGISLSIFWNLPESRSEAVAERARNEHPLRGYLALSSNRRLLGYLLSGALNSASKFAYIGSAADVLIGVYGLSRTQLGLILGINSAGLIAASYFNRRLLERFTPDRILRSAVVASATFALLLIAMGVSGVRELAAVLILLFFMVATSSVIQANTLAGALAVDPNRAGSVAALFGAGGLGIGALASSLVGALHDGTVRPMAFVLAACLLGCVGSLYRMALPEQQPSEDHVIE